MYVVMMGADMIISPYMSCRSKEFFLTYAKDNEFKNPYVRNEWVRICNLSLKPSEIFD